MTAMNNSVIGEEYPVLSSHNLEDGTITLIQISGNEDTIVNAARVSFGGGLYRDPEKNKRLIRRLMSDKHYGVLEHCFFTIRVVSPIFVARQWFRHRSLSYNEYSLRYSDISEDATFYIPIANRFNLQSTDNKQGSSSQTLDESAIQNFQLRLWSAQERDLDLYNDMLQAGVAREVARIALPTAIFTKFYASGNLRNWINFVELRSDSHAQYEIRVYADFIKDTIIKTFYPTVYESVFGEQKNG